jgi:hypothetical protein
VTLIETWWAASRRVFPSGYEQSVPREIVEAGDALADALAALLAEAATLREALGWIADPSYVGNYDDRQVVEIYRKWAVNALASSAQEPAP